MDKYKNRIQLMRGNKKITKEAEKKINSIKALQDEKRRRSLSFTPFSENKSFLRRNQPGKETERHLSYHRDSDGARFKTKTQLVLESKAGRNKLEPLEKELLMNLKEEEENSKIRHVVHVQLTYSWVLLKKGVFCFTFLKKKSCLFTFLKE